MIDLSVIQAISEAIQNIDSSYDLEIRNFENGEFGDLREIDFSNGTIMGHVAVWSSGMGFLNLIDGQKNIDCEVIEETYIDAVDMSNDDLLSALSELFKELNNRRRFSAS